MQLNLWLLTPIITSKYVLDYNFRNIKTFKQVIQKSKYIFFIFEKVVSSYPFLLS